MRFLGFVVLLLSAAFQLVFAATDNIRIDDHSCNADRKSSVRNALDLARTRIDYADEMFAKDIAKVKKIYHKVFNDPNEVGFQEARTRVNRMTLFMDENLDQGRGVRLSMSYPRFSVLVLTRTAVRGHL